MLDTPLAVEAEYRALLEEYLEGKEELALLDVYELGKKAAAADLGFVEFVRAHHAALGDLIGGADSQDAAGDLIARSTILLTEGLAAFQLSHGGHRQGGIAGGDIRAQLRRVLDHLPALVWVKDANDRLLEANELLAAAIGKPVTEILGKTAAELFGPPRPIVTTTERRVRMTGLSELSEESVTTATGVRTFLVARFLIGDHDAALCTIATEITDRVDAEDRAWAARQQAEESNTAKSEFLSGMSHELRTPLNSVMGFGQLLQRDELTADQAEATDHIVEAGRHLLQLIDEVLDISRIESGRLDLDLGPVDLLEATNAAVELIRPSATERDVTIDVKVDGTLLALADGQRLAQILLNLLTNAVKYNHDGGSIVVTAPNVTSGRVALSVSDTGSGVRRNDLPRVFEPFDRLGAERTNTEGTGLGLSLSLGLARLMGGSLSVASTQGKGSSFTLELQATEGRPTEAAASPTETRSTQPETGLTVVCIEDNVANRTLIQQAVTRLRPNSRVLTAANGRSGIALVRRERPDLVLLDLHVPDLPGEVVLTELKSDRDTHDIPVVIVSATAERRSINRLKARGATDYITKPIDLDELHAILDATVPLESRATF